MDASNVLAPEHFIARSQCLIGAAREIIRDCSISADRPVICNLGGGIGVAYQETERQFNFSEFESSFLSYWCQLPKAVRDRINIWSEMSRILVARSGVFVANVVAVEGGPNYQVLTINAGSAQFPRPCLYGGYHQAEIIARGIRVRNDNYVSTTVHGIMCDSLDVFCKDRKMLSSEIGDRIVFFDAGAHCSSMASNYNGIARPCEFIISIDANVIAGIRGEEINELISRHLV